MQFSTFVASESGLLTASQANSLKEVLIEPRLLAREGRLDRLQAEKLAVKARQLKLLTVLVWDILMTDNDFQLSITELNKYDLKNFNAIRVQCPGAAFWLKENHPEIKLHYIAETGNNNFSSLQAWIDNLGSNLQRLVLNIQLPEEKLCEYIKKLPVECEILGAGRILIFYSRRKLLHLNFSEQIEDPESPWIEVVSDSEDSQHRQLPVIENLHGTFMFLDKDQFILDKLDKLENAGIHTVRIDLRHLSQENPTNKIDQICSAIINKDSSLRTNWPRKVIAPFFKSNLTTKQFVKLKSKLKTGKDSDCLAELISCENGKLLAFYTLRAFDPQLPMVLNTPQQKMVECNGINFRDLSGNPLDFCEANRLVTSFSIKGASVGSILKRGKHESS